MLIFYRITLGFYWLIIRIMSPFHEKARKFSEGRKNWRRTLSELFSGNAEPVIWVHAASLGEFEQGRPVIEKLKEVKPDRKILLTFFSPSGYEIRKNYQHADWIVYLPIDSPGNARDFIQITNPALAIFIKYEYWYCYLKELNRAQIPVLMISAIFRENQLFFHTLGSFYRKALKWIDWYFVQDEKSIELLNKIGISQAEIAGDTRFDRVVAISKEALHLPVVEKFKKDNPIIVLGSVWESDMREIVPLIELYSSKFKFIIAPHNIDEGELTYLERQFENTVRYSTLDETASDETANDARILIIDNIGMLSSIYRYGDFAIIGGAFRGALHNTLEAAVYGIPVLFGEHENNRKFKEAIELTAVGGAFEFKDSNELIDLFEALLEPGAYEEAATSSSDFVRENMGATDMVVEKTREFLV